MLVVLEPPALIVAWFLADLANGHLVAIALVGGLFISLPSLAIFGLAVMWDRRLGRIGPSRPARGATARAPRGSRRSRRVVLALGGGVALLGAGRSWRPRRALSRLCWLMARAPV